MDHHFGCMPDCGGCCHDLRVPLSRREAVAWLERGDVVEAICDATPWFEEPSAGDAGMAYTRDRSFPASSGAVPVRITLRLVASFQGPCPNRQADMRCRIYPERPRVCRIYPADIFPFGVFDPTGKNCPPEAWDTAYELLIRDGRCVAPETAALIEDARTAAREDAAAAAALCARLGIAQAGLANEGYAVHTPAPEALLGALRWSLATPDTPQPHGDWLILSNRPQTVDALKTTEAHGAAVQRGDLGNGRQYLGLFDDAV